MNDRRLIVTIFISFGLHAMVVAAALLFSHAGPVPSDGPEKPTEVELVLEEHKGDIAPTSAPPPAPLPAAKIAQPAAERRTDPLVETPLVRPPVEALADAKDDIPEPSKRSDPPAKQAVRAEPAPRAPPAEQPAPVITLRGTDSPSAARAWGNAIIPAAPDAVFHNRPPEYPSEASRRGEQGDVVVVIHISPAGRAAGVDVVRSSGYALLDRAAREAVLRWRFLPAVKGGQPVASDMTMRFVFDNE